MELDTNVSQFKEISVLWTFISHNVVFETAIIVQVSQFNTGILSKRTFIAL